MPSGCRSSSPISSCLPGRCPTPQAFARSSVSGLGRRGGQAFLGPAGAVGQRVPSASSRLPRRGACSPPQLPSGTDARPAHLSRSAYPNRRRVCGPGGGASDTPARHGACPLPPLLHRSPVLGKGDPPPGTPARGGRCPCFEGHGGVSVVDTGTHEHFWGTRVLTHTEFRNERV
jgi:hypothetical protein